MSNIKERLKIQALALTLVIGEAEIQLILVLTATLQTLQLIQVVARNPDHKIQVLKFGKEQHKIICPDIKSGHILL